MKKNNKVLALDSMSLSRIDELNEEEIRSSQRSANSQFEGKRQSIWNLGKTIWPNKVNPADETFQLPQNSLEVTAQQDITMSEMDYNEMNLKSPISQQQITNQSGSKRSNLGLLTSQKTMDDDILAHQPDLEKIFNISDQDE